MVKMKELQLGQPILSISKMLYFTGLEQHLDKRHTNTHLADSQLVTSYKETGDQQYLLTLYQRYSGLLFGVCLKYLKSTELARDACTDIYEELVNKLLKHEVDNFKGWLHVLAKNHCLQKLRSQKKSVTADLPEDIMQSDETLHLEEMMDREANINSMENCLEQLNTDQKRMVELFYLEQKCYNEITAITGYSWNAVRSHIQNARRNLKICMDKFNSE